MLFGRGKRPDRDAIRAFVTRCPAVSISHDPHLDDTPHAETLRRSEQRWLELLRDGLTFDLTGLAPGPESALPDLAQRFDLPTLPDLRDHEAMMLRPGPHVASAGNSMPVIRTMMALACDLVRYFDDLRAVGWGPANSVIGRRFFESVTTAWLDGGPFPALGMTAFVEAPDGALQSVGLAFWIDRELRIEPPLSADRVAATRLAIRLINHLILIGGLEVDDHITAPDGSRLILRPSRERALISVWRE